MEGLGGFLPEDPAPVPLPQRHANAGAPPAALGPVPPPSASYVDDLAEADTAAVAEGCSCCSSLSFSQEWLAAFGVALCAECRHNEKLISKVGSQEVARFCCCTGSK